MVRSVYILEFLPLQIENRYDRLNVFTRLNLKRIESLKYEHYVCTAAIALVSALPYRYTMLYTTIYFDTVLKCKPETCQRFVYSLSLSLSTLHFTLGRPLDSFRYCRPSSSASWNKSFAPESLRKSPSTSSSFTTVHDSLNQGDIKWWSCCRSFERWE